MKDFDVVGVTGNDDSPFAFVTPPNFGPTQEELLPGSHAMRQYVALMDGLDPKTLEPKDALPTNKKLRKESPIARGVLDYFPKALACIANVSYVGNEQHNPGEPMHWAKEKSADHADCIVRHLIDRGKIDTDGLRHTAKVAWRALALLETELEGD